MLRRLLHGEAEAAELSQLAELASEDGALARRIAGELSFSELLREVLVGAGDSAPERFEADLASSALPMDELARRVREGEASPFECDRVALHLSNAPEEARAFRRDLAVDEWLREAVSGSKDEAAFVASLETRMWAETRRDHFVDDFAKRLERELEIVEVPEPQVPDNLVAFPGAWAWTALKMASLAAAVGIGAFVVVQLAVGRIGADPTLGAVVKATPDAAWSEGASPRDDGTLGPGIYELRSGVVSMRMASGSELTVEGPARFEVDKDASTFVHAGIALARTSSAEGAARIGSNGLSFSEPARLIGIDARAEDATEAVVFNGDGGICLTGSGKCRDLFEFEAVKADRRRDRLVDVPYNPHAFSKAWALASGVENRLGQVRIELPGPIFSAAGGIDGEVRVFLENESFRPANTLEVDRIVAGAFAFAEPNPGESLEARGDLRSYLVQLPRGDGDGTGGDVETSLTFDHPVVGVIFSSDRLEGSDASVGSTFSLTGTDENPRRGMDSGEDEILLSEDRRTLNLRFKGGSDHAEQVRILVALN